MQVTCIGIISVTHHSHASSFQVWHQCSSHTRSVAVHTFGHLLGASVCELHMHTCSNPGHSGLITHAAY